MSFFILFPNACSTSKIVYVLSKGIKPESESNVLLVGFCIFPLLYQSGSRLQRFWSLRIKPLVYFTSQIVSLWTSYNQSYDNLVMLQYHVYPAPAVLYPFTNTHINFGQLVC